MWRQQEKITSLFYELTLMFRNNRKLSSLDSLTTTTVEFMSFISQLKPMPLSWIALKSGIWNYLVCLSDNIHIKKASWLHFVPHKCTLVNENSTRAERKHYLNPADQNATGLYHFFFIPPGMYTWENACKSSSCCTIEHSNKEQYEPQALKHTCASFTPLNLTQ